jgi:hypothetical protein
LVESRALGRFLLRAGQEILMDMAPTSNLVEVRAYLLGAIFGALCHQRGITPLHAAAIDLANGRVAFVGASGAGKSTLIAALARRGHEVISDDECFLELSDHGNVRTWPGIAGIRLWEDATVALGFEDPGLEQGTPKYKKKYSIPIHPRTPTQPRPLFGVYQLHRATNCMSEITRLRGADAIEVLLQNVYPPGVSDRLGYQSHVFSVCTAVARNVPVFRLSRPWDFAALGEVCDMLENHLSTISR